MTVSLHDLDADLDAHIVGDLHYPGDDAEPATLADIDQADRALRRIGRLERDLHRLEQLAEARKAQIDEFLRERSDVILRERDWWLRSVEGWTRAHHAETGTKTVKLPSGTVQLRRAKPKVEALDDPTDDTPAELVRVKRSWDKTAVRQVATPGPELDDVDAPDGYHAHAAVTADGELLAGVVLLVPGQDSFSVRAGGGDE